jgi:hypothetical protein
MSALIGFAQINQGPVNDFIRNTVAVNQLPDFIIELKRGARLAKKLVVCPVGEHAIESLLHNISELIHIIFALAFFEFCFKSHRCEEVLVSPDSKIKSV